MIDKVKPCVMAQIYNPSILELEEAGKADHQSYLRLHRKLEASLDCVSPCIEKQKINNNLETNFPIRETITKLYTCDYTSNGGAQDSCEKWYLKRYCSVAEDVIS